MFVFIYLVSHLYIKNNFCGADISPDCGGMNHGVFSCKNVNKLCNNVTIYIMEKPKMLIILHSKSPQKCTILLELDFQ